jgi:hypothetical protein
MESRLEIVGGSYVVGQKVAEVKASFITLVKPVVGRYPKTTSDADLSEAQKLFDLDLWSYAVVTQAFLPP